MRLSDVIARRILRAQPEFDPDTFTNDQNNGAALVQVCQFPQFHQPFVRKQQTICTVG